LTANAAASAGSTVANNRGVPFPGIGAPNHCACGRGLGPNNRSGVCGPCKRICACGSKKEPAADRCVQCKTTACTGCGRSLGPRRRGVTDERCFDCRKHVTCPDCGQTRLRAAKTCIHCRRAETARRKAAGLPPPSLGRQSKCPKCHGLFPTGDVCKPCRRQYMNEYNRTHLTSVCTRCGTERYRHKTCGVCFPGKLRAATNERRRKLRESLGKYVPERPMCKGCGTKPVPNAKRTYCDDCKPERGPKPTDEPVACSKCGSLRRVGRKCLVCTRERMKSSKYVTTDQAAREQPPFCIACRAGPLDGQSRYCGNCIQERRFKMFQRYRTANAERVGDWKITQAHRRRATELNAHGSHTLAEWEAIKTKQGHVCVNCPSSGPFHRDHILPLSRGGTNFAYNIQALCYPCNGEKSDHIPELLQLSLWDRLELLEAPPRRRGPKPIAKSLVTKPESRQ
jgi:HNH endonuclease